VAASAAAPVESEPVETLVAGPVLSDEIRLARDSAQRAVLGAEAPLVEDLPVEAADREPAQTVILALGESKAPEHPSDAADPSDAEEPAWSGPLPGRFVPLEHPPGPSQALQTFENALSELEAGTRTEPVRLAFYGASGVSADLWTGYVRHYLQTRFGDGGPGMVLPAKPTRWYRHQEFSIHSSKRGWTKHNSYRLQDEDDPGLFGAMGQAMSAEKSRAWTRVDPGRRARSPESISWFELQYLEAEDAGRLRVRVDGESVALLKTTPGHGDDGLESHGWGRRRFAVEPGRHEVEVRVTGDGPVRLLGLTAETGSPGVVLDTLGVNGARVANHRAWNEALWSDHLRSRDPALYVLMYGNNESVDEDEPIAVFEDDYRFMLERFQRALPEASCVVFGPGDFPILDDEGVAHPRPKLAEIHAVERRLAAEYGCAFFDFRAVLGGELGIADWVAAGLAKDDHLHMTRPGYVRLGMGFADALMQGYDRSAAKHG
jgi:hypothetical protein